MHWVSYQTLQGISYIVSQPAGSLDVEAHIHFGVDLIDVLTSSTPASREGHRHIVCTGLTVGGSALKADHDAQELQWQELCAPLSMRLTTSSGN